MEMQAPSLSPRARRLYRLWLQLCIVLVLCMVAVGGVTRLTESGLSIVEWKLLSGTFPPLSEQAWQAEFEAYQRTPEFIKKNHFMELEDFERIFWLEYLHRLLGRVIGLVYALPLLAAVLRPRSALPAPHLRRAGLLFALVCAQGAMGWYMVKSGLVDVPWVSPYRLAAHLLLATVILGLTWRTLLALRLPVAPTPAPRSGWVILAAIGIQIAYGAFVAGLDAGMTYNTFPLMDGQFLPAHAWMLEPLHRNLFEHIPMVQFIHRWFAFVVLAMLFWQWLHTRSRSSLLVLSIGLVQVVLGVATLLSVVDITLASVHQIVAMLLVLAQLHHIARSAAEGNKISSPRCSPIHGGNSIIERHRTPQVGAVQEQQQSQACKAQTMRGGMTGITTPALLLALALTSPAHALELELPVDCTLGKDCFIQNYVDQGAGADYHDFRCGALSYNEHKGTDFRMPTLRADGTSVTVIASAAGTVRGLRDGEVDMLSTREDKPDVTGKECGNGVVLRHDGGWETQYCHLKSGSIRVREGQRVKAGDALGEIGLSGKTEFPHLHLQVRDPDQRVIDPFNAQPMESGCSETDKPAAQLWSKAARHQLNLQETGLLAAGIAPRTVDVRDVLEGKYQETLLPPSSPAMVLWMLAYGLQKGDELTMLLFDTDGTPFVEHHDTITGTKAQYLQFIGKRLTEPHWRTGRYEGLVALKRGDKVLFERTVTFDVGMQR